VCDGVNLEPPVKCLGDPNGEEHHLFCTTRAAVYSGRTRR